MDFEGEISLFQSYRCDLNCPNVSNNYIKGLDLQCDHICYDQCQAMCVDDYDPLFQFELRIEKLMFMIGNALSILGLSLTFLTFCAFPKLRNVSGKCVMNLVIALAIAKVTFQINPSFTKINHSWCSVMAMAQHYFCLCAFHWTSVMAFDLYLTVKHGRRASETTKGKKQTALKKSKKHPSFVTYCFFAWGFPWSAVVSCITVESLTHFKFHYGNHEHCGVFGDDVLLYSLAIPLLVITLLNMCLFIVIVCHPGLHKQVTLLRARKYSLKHNKYLQQVKSTVVKRDMIVGNVSGNQKGDDNGKEIIKHHDENIRTWQEQIPNTYPEEINNETPMPTTTKENQQDDPMKLYKAEMHEINLLRIYVNMSFLMAIAWLSGFLAAFIRVYEIWIFFIVWNTLQGLFIFKSIVLQPAVRKMWVNEIKSWYSSKEQQNKPKDDTHKSMFLGINLPKKIMARWQNNKCEKIDKQPLYISNVNL